MPTTDVDSLSGDEFTAHATTVLARLERDRDAAGGRFPLPIFLGILQLTPTVYCERFVFMYIDGELHMRLELRPENDSHYAGLHAGFGGMIQMRELLEKFFARMNAREFRNPAPILNERYCGTIFLHIPRQHGAVLLYASVVDEEPPNLPGVWAKVADVLRGGWRFRTIPSTIAMLSQVLEVMEGGEPPRVGEFHHATDHPEGYVPPSRT